MENKLHFGDCLEFMRDIPDDSIDMVLADLPYGTTVAHWDKIIPMEKLWEQYLRIVKDNAPMVFTANQPFTSLLITSNIKMFRHEWIWNKHNASNFANAKKAPLKQHESIIVFSKKATNYFPQMVEGKPNHKQGNSKINRSDTRIISGRSPDDLSGMKYPKTILDFPKHSSQVGLHPTQKPVALFEYLIRTYSLPNNIILDNCIGSGTTAIAAINTNRKWIGIESNKEYYDIALARIENHKII